MAAWGSSRSTTSLLALMLALLTMRKSAPLVEPLANLLMETVGRLAAPSKRKRS